MEFRLKGYVNQRTNSHLRTWVRRYLGLTQDTLYIFKNAKDKKAISDIECASIYRVDRVCNQN